MTDAEKQRQRANLARELCVLADGLSDWATLVSESNEVTWEGVDGAEMYLRRIAADVEKDPAFDTNSITAELYGLGDLLGNCAAVLEGQDIKSSVLRSTQSHIERVAVDLYRLDDNPPVDDLSMMADKVANMSAGSVSLFLLCLSEIMKGRWLREKEAKKNG